MLVGPDGAKRLRRNAQTGAGVGAGGNGRIDLLEKERSIYG